MIPATQDESKPSSRRALLAGALGGLGALAASGIGRASRTRAATGDPMLAGQVNVATTPTDIENTTIGGTSLQVNTQGAGTALSATANDGTAIHAQGWLYGVSSMGVFGPALYGKSTSTAQAAVVGYSFNNNWTGVQGFSGGPTSTLPAAPAKTGVYGYANQDGNARGIYGKSVKGYAGYFAGKVHTTQWYEMVEISTPATPSASRARLFIRDSAGKTQLCVKFGNGQVKLLASET